MSARASLCVSWLMWCACAPARDVPELERSQQAVFNGAAAPTEHQVFLLDVRTNTGNASICSAVLVSPRVLLTAAHCVDPAFHAAQSVTVRALNKPDISNVMLSDTIVVLTISRHPQWNVADPESDFDLAALLLTSAPNGVQPAPLASSFANPVGAAVKVVGYGRLVENMPATSGVRRAATLTVTDVTPLHFQFGDAMNGLCVGDSGGPSFLGSEVVGIHSRTPGAALCDEGIDIRVDAHRAFIDAFIAANDPPRCTADGRCASACTTADPDCACGADGTCVAGCAQTDPDCAPCAANGACGASCGASDPDCCGTDASCDPACGPADADCCRADGSCGAGCGARDADCCATDGACDAACGQADADCCATDGACDAACGQADADCRCRAADATCGAGCGASDADCCAADGACDAACGAADADCRCAVDGRCDEGCSPVDTDCCATDGRCGSGAPDGAACASATACAGGACVGGRCTRPCGDDAACGSDATCRAGTCAPRGCGCTSPGGLALSLAALALSRTRRARSRRSAATANRGPIPAGATTAPRCE